MGKRNESPLGDLPTCGQSALLDYDHLVLRVARPPGGVFFVRIPAAGLDPERNGRGDQESGTSDRRAARQGRTLALATRRAWLGEPIDRRVLFGV